MNAIENPYVGPQPFKEKERDRFFGRKREARDLLALVLSEQLVLFYAQSGAGKSSLVNTCLKPDLKMKGFEIFLGRVAGDAPPDIQPENIFVFNLLRSLAPDEVDLDSLGKMTISAFLLKLRADAPVEEMSEDDEEEGSKRRALIIDQFEELFSTHDEAWAKREGFFQQLAQAMEDDPYLWVILVMREDFIASLDPYAYLVPGRFRRRYYMQRLERNAALEAIKKPVQNLRPYAEGVAEKLVADLGSVKVYKPDGTPDIQPGQYVEPVQLQVICYNLWKNLSPGGTQITEKDIQDVGDVNTSLGNYYADRVRAVAEGKNANEGKIREWFSHKLISPGGVRNMVLKEPGKKSSGLENDIILALPDLIRAEQRGGATFYELTHDRLVIPILENNAEWEKKHAFPYRQQAESWKESSGKEKDTHLLSDEVLVQAIQWAKNNPDYLTDVEDEFIKACQAKQAERLAKQKLDAEREQLEITQRRLELTQKLANEKARSAQRQRLFTIIAAILATVAVIATFFAITNLSSARRSEAIAVQERNRAADERNAAILARATAEAASDLAQQQAHLAQAAKLAVQSQTNDSTQLSFLLGIEALNEAAEGGEPHLAAAEDVLREALEQSRGSSLFENSTFVSAVAFSPTGERLATASSDDTTVRLWDVETGQPVGEPLVGHFGPVTSVAFSQDGSTLASGSYDGTAILWDVETGQPIGEPLVGHSDAITSVAFSGNTLASGSYDKTIILWDVETGQPVGEPLLGHTDLVTSVAFSPDGRTLASGSYDTTVRLWDVETGQPIGEPLAGHSDIVTSVAFRADGRTLASGSADNTVILRDVETGLLVNQLSGHTDNVTSVAFSPDGRNLASGSYDKTIILWDVETVQPLGEPLVGHTDLVTSVAFSSDGITLASGSADTNIRLWNTPTLFAREQFVPQFEVVDELEGNVDKITNLAFSPDGIWLASAGAGTPIQLWRFQTGIPDAPDSTLEKIVYSLVYDPYGQILHAGGRDKSLYSWNLAAETPIQNLRYLPDYNDSERTVPTLAYSPCPSLGGGCWASVTDDQLYFLAQDTAVQLKTTQEWKVQALAMSPDGRWLVAGSTDGTIYVWRLDVLNREDLAAQDPVELSHEGGAAITSLAFSRDSYWLASAGMDGTVSVWDTLGGDILTPAIREFRNQDPISLLTFSPAGRWLAGSGSDANVHLWDLDNLESAPIHLTNSKGPVSAIAFSPDGRWLVTGAGDDTIQVWGVTTERLKLEACRAAKRNLEWHEWISYFENENYRITCTDYPFPDSVAAYFLESGDQLAREKKIDAAVTEYREALQLHPELGEHVSDPLARANSQAAQALLDEGDALAREAQIDAAINTYQEALKFDATIIPDNVTPEDRAKELGFQKLIETLSQLNYAGMYEEMALSFLDARNDYPTIVEDIEDQYILNNVCWWGSLLGRPQDVSDACEKAVELGPDYGSFIDSRGLNYALLGKYDLAIADFEVAAAWFRDFGYLDYADQREEWVRLLREEKDPFDETLLESLKGQ